MVWGYRAVAAPDVARAACRLDIGPRIRAAWYDSIRLDGLEGQLTPAVGAWSLGPVPEER
jgi:hypothetical protein